jgi:hypothetical protein
MRVTAELARLHLELGAVGYHRSVDLSLNLSLGTRTREPVLSTHTTRLSRTPHPET